MTVGDPVTTPNGAGVIIRVWYQRGLNAGRPYHLAWIRVRLHEDFEHMRALLQSVHRQNEPVFALSQLHVL